MWFMESSTSTVYSQNGSGLFNLKICGDKKVTVLFGSLVLPTKPTKRLAFSNPATSVSFRVQDGHCKRQCADKRRVCGRAAHRKGQGEGLPVRASDRPPMVSFATGLVAHVDPSFTVKGRKVQTHNVGRCGIPQGHHLDK